jgi:hypothetical protein
VRIIGDRYYTRFSGAGQPWRTGRGTLVEALVLNGGRAWGPTDGASANPAVLLAALHRLGSVRPHQLTGTIVVHDQSNLIAKITMRASATGPDERVAGGGRTTFTTVMTFSDYGVPVSVQVPTGAVQLLRPLL